MQTNPVKAIREKCIDCCGGSHGEVKMCPCTDCALYPFRFGKNPYRQRREMTDEQRKVLGDRLREARKNNSRNVE